MLYDDWDWGLAFARCIATAAAWGGLAGAGCAIGADLIDPAEASWFVDALFGGFIGAWAGGAYGLVDGVIRVAVFWRWRPRSGVVRALTALTYGCAGVLVGLVGLSAWPWAVVGCGLVGAAVGALVGLQTLLGVSERATIEILGLVVGAVLVGAVVGGVVGLVIGVHDPWGLVPVAIVEGAMLGGGAGALLAALAVLVWLPWLRPARMSG